MTFTDERRIPRAQALRNRRPFRSFLRTNVGTKFKLYEPEPDDEFLEDKIDPKNLATFKPVEGRTPRRVAVDRQKKTFDQVKIGDLLREKNVDFNIRDSQAEWLDYELFADSTFNEYADEEWLAKLRNEDGVEKIMTGMGLHRNEDGYYSWQQVIVQGYDRENQKFQCIWRKDQNPVELLKINLCLDAEDPYRFVNKMVMARQQRIYADSLIRYHAYIANMSIEGIYTLDSESLKRIDRLVRTKALSLGRFTEVFQEANVDYQYVMNRLILDKWLTNPGDLESHLPKNLTFPEKKMILPSHSGLIIISKNKENREFYTYKNPIATVPLDFEATYKQFCFSSILIKQQVYEALKNIRAYCNRTLELEVFNIEQGTSSGLEAFRHIQESAISQLLYHLKETWIQDMLSTLTTQLTAIGKGWFNMNETSKITYEFGKLKRLLTVARLMMQDTILTLVRRSITGYANGFHQATPDSVEIVSVNQVDNHFSNEIDAEKYYPCFDIVIELSPLTNHFRYSKDPEKYVSIVLFVLERALEEIAKIPNLEPKILTGVYKGQAAQACIRTPMKPREKPKEPVPGEPLSTVWDENAWVWTIFEDLQITLNKAMTPMRDYLSLFQEFNTVIALDTDQYIYNIEFDEIPWTLEQVKEEIQRVQEQRDSLNVKLQEFVNISIFRVDLRDVRDIVIAKLERQRDGLIQMIAKRANQSVRNVFTQYMTIEQVINTPPKDIDALVGCRDYMKSVNNQIIKLQQEIQRISEIYASLEIQQYRLAKEDFDKYWHIFGGQKNVLELISRREVELEKDQIRFTESMKNEQEEFKEQIENIMITVQNFHTYENMAEHEMIAQMGQEINKQLETFQQQAKKYNNNELLIKKDVTNYDQINDMIKMFSNYSNFWSVCSTWLTSHEKWLHQDWDQLDALSADRFVEDALRSLAQCQRYFRDTSPIEHMRDKVKIIQQEILEFKPKVPLMMALHSPGMVERHWQEIAERTGIALNPESQSFNFTTVLEAGLMDHIDACIEIGEKALKEYQIEASLDSMQNAWEDIFFEVLPFKGTFILKGFDDIQALLDDHIINTQALQFSRFRKPYEDRITSWSQKLKLASEVLEEWAQCQGQWMYLQPIFDSADIGKQLPTETKKFKTIDSAWRHTMNAVRQVSKVLEVCTQEGLFERLKESNQNLENIQKALNDYLESKREKFARFYFLSNDDLLEILSHAKEPTAVQPHLKKVFENIHSIEFDREKRILAMLSAEQEKIEFIQPVEPRKKDVEDWMGELEQAMFAAVRQALINSINDYPQKERADWVLQHPGQCVLNGSQFMWTSAVEEALSHRGVKGIKEQMSILNTQLDQLVVLVRRKLTPMQKITLNALIVLDVHAKDVVERLVNEHVDDVAAFEWISQLRYYWENNNAYIKCIQTVFPYGYEYLGNTLRLVITPLTDKCYMTLMGALKLNLGGAPAGPAGTGKTESTKDLAKALAKQCVVFNCSDSMDYLMLGKFFKGLASAGAWCCFDEFNRINIEVLSVIAQQLLSLFSEKAKNSTIIEFEGSTIKILPTFSVFITMNPGYAGRTELPDNLKALFRSVAMMVPDYAMIGEILLYSFGFTKGRSLARKMVATFKLSSEQLSSQDHYDYGMRAVRSVIDAAGHLKSADPDMDEEQLLLQALLDVNLPKFLKEDLPQFQNILQDLFPGLEKPHVDYAELLEKIKQQCVKRKLQEVPEFIGKILQLYDTIQVRHGLMLVGPTGGGKTVNYQILSSAISQTKDVVQTHIVNPKSITMGQLYGQFNEQTHEWTDGILAYRVRECCKDQSTTKHWIIFDGPVDSLWIESMNTVLDDNKKLCLNSGQILQLTPHMTMIFEVEDLQAASPATVSRCGMVYMEPESIGLDPLFTSWTLDLPSVLQMSDNVITMLQQFWSDNVLPSLSFVRKNLKEQVSTADNQLIQSYLRLLSTYLQSYVETDFRKVTHDEIEHLVNIELQPLCLFCLVWTVGCTSDTDGRQRFNNFLRKNLKGSFSWPSDGDKEIYDFEFDCTEGIFVPWKSRFQNFLVDSRLEYHELMIPTEDSVRSSYLMTQLIQQKASVLCVGPTGTGKTANIFQLLSQQLDQEHYQYLNIILSAQTTANQLQLNIENALEKRRKGIYGPPIGIRCVIFIDDLNMPKKEQYGAQPPIELLRQYMDYGGWYNRKDMSWIKFEDLVILAAMGPPGGGRSVITNRLQRHFNLIGYTELSQNTINQIFSTLIKSFFSIYSEHVIGLIPQLVSATIDVYNNIRRVFLPTPTKSHYTFNMRDIWKVFQGLTYGSVKYTGDVATIAKLWYHENLRVFHDRLVSESDRENCKQILLEHLEQIGFQKESVLNQDRIIFADFLQGRDLDIRYYQHVNDLDNLIHKMESFQDDYNADSTFIQAGPKQKLKLVMFLDACDHITRISRIIRQPQGNVLILGVGGSGRQSLSRLATFLAGYKLFQIEVIKNYSVKSWREDLKTILMFAALENKQITFLITDTQIVDQSMVEDINSLLNSSDITGLYMEKDLEEIANTFKTECLRRSIQPTKVNIYAQFVRRLRQNIHVVFAMSPLSSTFSARLRMFPALVNCSTIDWFSDWPEQALLGVATGQLLDFDENLKLGPNMDKYVKLLTLIHKSVEAKNVEFMATYRRFNYVTPTSFLELIRLFQSILTGKLEKTQLLVSRLKSGLSKLMDANRSVEEMQLVLKEKQPKLEQASQEADVMVKKIDQDRAEAEATQRIVAEDEAETTQQTLEAQALAQKAETAVADANLQLEQTLLEVQKLKKEHLVEIKSLISPPNAVRITLGGVVILNTERIKKGGGEILMGYKDPTAIAAKKEENYFETAKRYLLNDTRELLEILQTYDRDNISAQTIKKLEEKVLNQPEFSLAAVERCSYATKFLYMWVKAMVDYYRVFTETKPLRERLIVMKQLVAKKTAELQKKKAALKQINDKLAELERLYQEKVTIKQNLAEEIQECQLKLDRASKLTQGLSDEKTRWAADIEAHNASELQLPAHSIVSAGMIAYCGAFIKDMRRELEQQWTRELGILGLDHDTNITMRSFLGDPIKLQTWNLAGLPKDETSTENGILIDQGRRWPLMIDPQGQAQKFIKVMGKDSVEGIEILKPTSANLMRVMELSVQFGKQVLLERVGLTIDPALDPIIGQQTTKVGGQLSIAFGDKTISYSPKFKFFLTTVLPNPHYPPEIFVKLTVINFAITSSGLEEQMLTQIIALENPDLEQRKADIVRKNALDAKQLVQIEDQILKSLSETGDIAEILKDESLINQLHSSKRFASEINQRVKESKETEKEIDVSRESYRSVAYRAALLFFCIVDLSSVDPMYQYSLQWFVNLFVYSVENSKPANVHEERLEILNNDFTYALYENVCRSLFERHKLLFSFILTAKILQSANQIDAQEWRYLLTGLHEDVIVKANPTTWIPVDQWPMIYRSIHGLNRLPNFAGIEDAFLKDYEHFKTIFDSPNPHLEAFPGSLAEKTMFQKSLFINALVPDKFIPAIQAWITQSLSESFIMSPPFELAKCFAGSSALTPLIFVLSSGSDPVADFLKFAEESQQKRRVESVSLGQGQGPRAYQMIKELSVQGGWVLLQNCHLAESWMPELEQICEGLNENMHKEFRLWLTSMPVSYFPINILQNGIKMTIEPPQGIRANLLGTYNNMSDQELQDCSKPDTFKKLLFGFSLFHAIIQDRRKFGAIGWNIPYEFTTADLAVCKRQLKMLLDEYADVPFRVLWFLGAEINYGGRVTDDKDVRLINTLIKQFVNKEILRDNVSFSRSGSYKSIKVGPLQTYLDYIASLPLHSAPEVFGMNDNVEIINSQNVSRDLLETTLAMQPRDTSLQGKSREEIIEDLVEQIDAKIPTQLNMEVITQKYPISYEESMNTVLYQEAVRYNRMLAITKESLKQLKRGLKGIVVMSEDLELIASSLYDNQVPAHWANRGFLSLKPLSSWMQDLIARVNFLNQWIAEGTPLVFWISGFFFPQAFITATLQNYARRHKIAIDTLHLDFLVLDSINASEIQEKLDDGCYVQGIFLEGTHWNSKKHYLDHQPPRELYSALPLLQLIPSQELRDQTQLLYNCPLYKTVSRQGTLSTTGHSTNFVLYIDLPTKITADQWITAGAAAFLALRY